MASRWRPALPEGIFVLPCWRCAWWGPKSARLPRPTAASALGLGLPFGGVAVLPCLCCVWWWPGGSTGAVPAGCGVCMGSLGAVGPGGYRQHPSTAVRHPPCLFLPPPSAWLPYSPASGPCGRPAFRGFRSSKGEALEDRSGWPLLLCRPAPLLSLTQHREVAPVGRSVSRSVGRSVSQSVSVGSLGSGMSKSQIGGHPS